MVGNTRLEVGKITAEHIPHRTLLKLTGYCSRIRHKNMTDKSIAWVDFTLLKYRQHGLNSIFLGPTVAQDKTGQILD